jgi:hypothetical protein
MVKEHVPTSLPRSPWLARSGIAATIMAGRGSSSKRGVGRSWLRLDPIASEPPASPLASMNTSGDWRNCSLSSCLPVLTLIQTEGPA